VSGTLFRRETGNDHTLYRQYAWNYRRWLSPDPGGVKVVNLQDPQTWNLYAYVRDNPTNLTDLSGLAGREVGQPGCIDEISMLGARDLYISQTIAPPGAFEKQNETRNKAQEQTPSHLKNAVRDLKSAVGEITTTATIGLGEGGKVTVGPLKARAEVAVKGSVSFSNGKLAISKAIEAGASVGAGKQIGLAGSVTQEVVSYDIKSGSFGGTQPAEAEWVVGVRSGGTSLEASHGALTFGSEEGDLVLGGGSISITRAGVQDVRNAWIEIESMF
jgi:RHS repeat-associated protein